MKQNKLKGSPVEAHMHGSSQWIPIATEYITISCLICMGESTIQKVHLPVRDVVRLRMYGGHVKGVRLRVDVRFQLFRWLLTLSFGWSLLPFSTTSIFSIFCLQFTTIHEK